MDGGRNAALDQLNVFIGRWLTEGETVPQAAAPPDPIVASDIYEWAPGRHFVVHPAYGRIGSNSVGGLEVIGYDASSGQFQTYFFDSQGNTSRETLTYQDGVWTWLGSTTRCKGVFSEDGHTLIARHERSDDGEHWTAWMTVRLQKID